MEEQILGTLLVPRRWVPCSSWVLPESGRAQQKKQKWGAAPGTSWDLAGTPLTLHLQSPVLSALVCLSWLFPGKWVGLGIYLLLQQKWECEGGMVGKFKVGK